MKIYIMAVGERDPHWKLEDGLCIKYNDLVKKFGENYEPSQIGVKEGPILSFFRVLTTYEQSPLKIYLLPTADRPNLQGTQIGGVKTKFWLEHDILKNFSDIEVFVRPIMVMNPTDHRELYPEVRREVLKIREEVKNEASEFFINLQPGTPQMRDIFISLAMLGIINPKFIEVTREEIIKETDLSFIFEDEVLKRAINLIREGYFSSAFMAFADLEEIAVLQESQRKAKIFQWLADLYAKWDILRYEEAGRSMRKILNEPDIKNYTLYTDLFNVLQGQSESLAKLKGCDMREYIIDLYHNAKRRLSQGNFPDTLWRFITIYELVLKLKATEAIARNYHLKVDTESFATSIASHRTIVKDMLKNAFDLRNIMDNREFYKKVPASLSKDHAERILEYLKDTLPKSISQFPIKKMVDKRNALLHRMKFPNEAGMHKDLDVIKEVINIALGHDPEKGYSLSVQTLDDLCKIIKEIYRKAG